MNLYGITANKVGVVNPLQNVQVQLSAGNVTNADGSRTPSYATPIVVQAQVQELSVRDLRQLDGLNISGSQRSIYFPGQVTGTVRFTQQGGDLITLADGTVWLTTSVLESWPTWSKVSVILHNGANKFSRRCGKRYTREDEREVVVWLPILDAATKP